MIDLSGKPKCEIICPFEDCSNLSKLSVVRQMDLAAAPKFNTYNFERHFQTQHLNKKRKAFDDLTNHSGETEPKISKSLFETQVLTEPQCVSIITSTPNDSRQESQCGESTEQKLVTMQQELYQMQEENIVLRHKLMDYRGTIRAFCRIKPDLTGDCFNWQRSKDGTILNLGSTDRFVLDYIFGPNHHNRDVFKYIKPMIKSASEGYNVSIIAYGASGTEI